MAEDSLPRKARAGRRRLEELSRRLEEIRADHEDRWQELRRKNEAATEAEDVQLGREAMEAVAREITDVWREEVALLAEFEAESMAVFDEMDAVAAEASVEGSKLRSEALKHQSTLAAGAIAGVAAITQVVMPQPLHAVHWLWFTYVVLLWTVGFSVMLMHEEARNAEHLLRTGVERSLPQWTQRTFSFFSIVSELGLVIAFGLFIIFQAFNQP